MSDELEGETRAQQTDNPREGEEGPKPPVCIGDYNDRHQEAETRREQTRDGPRWVCPICGKSLEEWEAG